MWNSNYKRLTLPKKGLGWLFVLVVSANLSFAQGPGTGKFKEGESARKAGDCRTAIAKYSEAISAEPSNYKYYFRKALCEIKEKDMTNAKISLENSARVNKNFSQAYTTLAKIYTKENDFNKAVENYNKAHEVEGDQAKKLTIKLAVIKLYVNKMNRPDDAMREIQALEGSFGSDPRVIYQKAEVLGAKGQWQPALDNYTAAYNKYLSLQQQNTAPGLLAKVGQGLAYYKLGNNAKYTEILNGLKSDNARYAPLLEKKAKGGSAAGKELRLAKSYFSAGAYEEALQWVNKSLEANKSALAYQMAGMIYNRTGQLSQAAQNYSQAAQLETDPQRKQSIYQALVKIQYNSKDYNGALASANQILASNPKDYKVLLMKAQAEYKLGAYQNSIKSAEAAMAASPQDAKRMALYNFTIGLAAKKAGDYNKARDAFKKAETISTFKVAAIEEGKSMSAK